MVEAEGKAASTIMQEEAMRLERAAAGEKDL